MKNSSSFVSRDRFLFKLPKIHWRWCIPTPPFVPVLLSGSMCSWTPRHPPKHPHPGLPDPPWRVSDRLVSPTMLCPFFKFVPSPPFPDNRQPSFDPSHHCWWWVRHDFNPSLTFSLSFSRPTTLSTNCVQDLYIYWFSRSRNAQK